MKIILMYASIQPARMRLFKVELDIRIYLKLLVHRWKSSFLRNHPTDAVENADWKQTRKLPRTIPLHNRCSSREISPRRYAQIWSCVSFDLTVDHCLQSLTWQVNSSIIVGSYEPCHMIEFNWINTGGCFLSSRFFARKIFTMVKLHSFSSS